MSYDSFQNQAGFQALAQFNANPFPSPKGPTTPKKASRTTFSTRDSPSTRYQPISSKNVGTVASTIPKDVQNAWDQREKDYNGLVLSGRAPPSMIRLSHRLDNGYCVLQHGGQPALWTHWNSDGRLVAEQKFTDHNERWQATELEVVFASDILRTLWTDFQAHNAMLRDDDLIRKVSNRYVGITSEDVLFVYGLHKHKSASKPKSKKAIRDSEESREGSRKGVTNSWNSSMKMGHELEVDDNSMSRKASRDIGKVAEKPRKRQKNNSRSSIGIKQEGAVEDNGTNTNRTLPPKAANDLRAELNAYVQQALFCAHGKIVEEHWKLSSKDMDRNKRLELERVLQDWARFCTDASASANELAKRQ